MASTGCTAPYETGEAAGAVVLAGMVDKPLVGIAPAPAPAPAATAGIPPELLDGNEAAAAACSRDPLCGTGDPPGWAITGLARVRGKKKQKKKKTKSSQVPNDKYD
jgi:hypothetical protein